MRVRSATLIACALLLGACTSTPSGDPAASTSASAPGAPVATSAPSTTVTTAPPILVDRGVGLESGVISIGLATGRTPEFVDAFATYWNTLNDGGGMGGFSVEVAGVETVAQAAELDLLAVTGAEPASGDIAAVADLITPTADEILASGHVLELLLGGGDPAEIRMIVDETSPDSCRSGPWTVVAATDAALDSGDVAVLCTDPQASASLLGEAGEFAAVSILARAWDPSLVDLVTGRPVEVIGTLPGPGVDDAPAGELVGTVLGDPPWTTEALLGYAAARSMHAVIDIALVEGDLRRASVAAAIDVARTLDFGFGNGIASGRPDPAAPTGVQVEAIYPDEDG